MSNPCIALLRHQLFLPSEVFITEQARTLRRFDPLLVGRVLGGAPCAQLAYFVPRTSALQRLNYVLRRDPQPFMRELTAQRPRLIHAHFGVEAVYGMEMAQRLGIPLVTTFHGFDATYSSAALLGSRKPSWINYLLKRGELKRRGTLFICVSEFIRSRLLRLGFPAERTRVHYIGVDPSTFPLAQPDNAAPLILHVARLVEKKGTRHLLEAFALIAARHPRAQLAIVGAGPLLAQLQHQAASLGIAARVRWLGALPHAEVRRWLHRASVFCLPSCTAESGDSEGLGLALLEAAASGVPVVATRHGGIPEAVIDERTGFLVPERDAARLADALDDLLGSEALRRRFGAAAREHVRGRFDLHVQTGALERLYEEAL